MKCPGCGKQMTKTGPGSWGCRCGFQIGVGVGIKRTEFELDKPVDSKNKVRNITDEVDPDLHRKP